MKTWMQKKMLQANIWYINYFELFYSLKNFQNMWRALLKTNQGILDLFQHAMTWTVDTVQHYTLQKRYLKTRKHQFVYLKLISILNIKFVKIEIIPFPSIFMSVCFWSWRRELVLDNVRVQWGYLAITQLLKTFLKPNGIRLGIDERLYHHIYRIRPSHFQCLAL